MSCRLGLRGACLALVVLALDAMPASAKIVLITRGETIAHVADIPSPMKEKVREELRKDTGKDVEPAIGFRYSYFGVFWIDFWTWGGKHCLYQDKTYFDAPPDFLAALINKSESDLSVPFLYRFPLGLLIAGGILVLVVIGGIASKASQHRANRLLNDPRYQKALEILAEQSAQEAAKASPPPGPDQPEGTMPPPPAMLPPPSNKPFEAAVDYLVHEGIPKEEAEKNLAFILTTMSAGQGQAAA
jgi:hypothetical protein